MCGRKARLSLFLTRNTNDPLLQEHAHHTQVCQVVQKALAGGSGNFNQEVQHAGDGGTGDLMNELL